MIFYECYILGTPATTTGPTDCEYVVTADTLSDLPLTFADGTVIELTPDGGLKFTFPEPRDITDINLQSPLGAPSLEALPETTDGALPEESPLEGSPGTPTTNIINTADVTSVTVRRDDGGEIQPEDFTSLEVIACEESKC